MIRCYQEESLFQSLLHSVQDMKVRYLKAKKNMVQKVFIHLNSIEKLEVGNKFLVEHQSIKIKYEKNCLEE